MTPRVVRPRSRCHCITVAPVQLLCSSCFCPPKRVSFTIHIFTSYLQPGDRRRMRFSERGDFALLTMLNKLPQLPPPPQSTTKRPRRVD